jgi:hypothetical protein
MNPRRILFLASNPRETGRLRLDQEIRDIEQSLGRSGRSAHFELEKRFALQARDLSRALLDFGPSIVHFSGHGLALEQGPDGEGQRSLSWEAEDLLQPGEQGSYSGGIALEDAAGKLKVLRAEPMAELFSLFADTLECVVLNACHSQLQSEALLSAGIRWVIGMKAAIPDETALRFAARFYDALGDGAEIPAAFAHAQEEIRAAGLPGAGLPVLEARQA